MKPGAPGDTYAIWQTGESFEVKVLTHQSSTNWHTAHGSLEGILERKVHISFGVVPFSHVDTTYNDE